MRSQQQITAVKAKAVLAADIIQALDARGLSVRAVADHTGIAYEEFRRLQDGRLDGFTAKRLTAILDKLMG